jgi:hypothetical protein
MNLSEPDWDPRPSLLRVPEGFLHPTSPPKLSLLTQRRMTVNLKLLITSTKEREIPHYIERNKMSRIYERLIDENSLPE